MENINQPAPSSIQVPTQALLNFVAKIDLLKTSILNCNEQDNEYDFEYDFWELFTLLQRDEWQEHHTPHNDNWKKIPFPHIYISFISLTETRHALREVEHNCKDLYDYPQESDYLLDQIVTQLNQIHHWGTEQISNLFLKQVNPSP